VTISTFGDRVLNSLEAMPFFLLTHKSLVEAHTEAAAAQNSVDQLRSACGDSVTAKSDGVTSKVVAIAALQSAAVLDVATAEMTSDGMRSAPSVDRFSWDKRRLS
jgi:hypothetical protein